MHKYYHKNNSRYHKKNRYFAKTFKIINYFLLARSLFYQIRRIKRFFNKKIN